MWLYFNKNGQLIESIEYGSQARSGTTDFEIFAVFQGVNIDTTYSNATIKLKKPDLDGSEYPLLLMEQKVKVFDHPSTNYFVSGQSYHGYYFDFADFNSAQDNEVLLDTPGLWKAVITLIGANRELNVQGSASFYVMKGSSSSQDPTEVSMDAILNNVYSRMGTKLNVASNRYLKVVNDISIYASEGFPESEFSIGDVILNLGNLYFYKLISLNYADKEVIGRVAIL